MLFFEGFSDFSSVYFWIFDVREGYEQLLIQIDVLLLLRLKEFQRLRSMVVLQLSSVDDPDVTSSFDLAN